MDTGSGEFPNPRGEAVGELLKDGVVPVHVCVIGFVKKNTCINLQRWILEQPWRAMKYNACLSAFAFALLSLAPVPLKGEAIAPNVGTLPEGPAITAADVQAAQKMWGDAVVAIGKAGDKAEETAEAAAKAAYAFDLGPIQFKPTLAAEAPFRPDLEGALSYFVGGNQKFTEDKGFALKPWSKVRFENHTVKMHGNVAIAMGHYFFTGPDGKETKVEYSKGYVKTKDGKVLLFLQDSSMPYGS